MLLKHLNRKLYIAYPCVCSVRSTNTLHPHCHYVRQYWPQHPPLSVSLSHIDPLTSTYDFLMYIWLGFLCFESAPHSCCSWKSLPCLVCECTSTGISHESRIHHVSHHHVIVFWIHHPYLLPSVRKWSVMYYRTSTLCSKFWTHSSFKSSTFSTTLQRALNTISKF